MFMVLVGLGGGAWLTVRELPAVVPSLFFAIAVASLTYRFLGGLGEEANVTLSKVLPVDVKLTGSIAALIGSGVLIYLAMSRDQQPPPPAFEPPVKEWLAFDRRNFIPRKVSIRQPGAEELIEVNRDFTLDPLWFRMDPEGGVYPEAAAATDGPGFYLGKVRPEDLPARVSGIELEGAALSLNLPPFSPPHKLRDLDIQLATCRYDSEHQFKLCAADCPPCGNGGESHLANGESELLAVDGRHFLVTAVESNLGEDEVVLQRISSYDVERLTDDNLVANLREIAKMIPIPESAFVYETRNVGAADREWDLRDRQGSWRVTVRTEGQVLWILYKYYARFLVAEIELAQSS